MHSFKTLLSILLQFIPEFQNSLILYFAEISEFIEKNPFRRNLLPAKGKQQSDLIKEPFVVIWLK